MATPGWIDLFVAPLERLGLPYMVTGSIASMLYGEPRLTLDLDLVVEIDAERPAGFLAAFPDAEFYRRRSRSCARRRAATRAATSN